MPKKKQEKFNKGEIIIYKPTKGEVELKVKLEVVSSILEQVAADGKINK